MLACDWIIASDCRRLVAWVQLDWTRRILRPTGRILLSDKSSAANAGVWTGQIFVFVNICAADCQRLVGVRSMNQALGCQRDAKLSPMLWCVCHCTNHHSFCSHKGSSCWWFDWRKGNMTGTAAAYWGLSNQGQCWVGLTSYIIGFWLMSHYMQSFLLPTSVPPPPFPSYVPCLGVTTGSLSSSLLLPILFFLPFLCSLFGGCSPSIKIASLTWQLNICCK